MVLKAPVISIVTKDATRAGNLRQATSTLYSTQDTRSVTNRRGKPLKYYEYTTSYRIIKTPIRLVTNLLKPLPKYVKYKIGLQAFTVVRFFLLGFRIIIISTSRQISGKQPIVRYALYKTRTGFLTIRQVALIRVTFKPSNPAAVNLVPIYAIITFYSVITGFYSGEKSRTRSSGIAYTLFSGIFSVLYSVTLTTVIVSKAARQALNSYNRLL